MNERSLSITASYLHPIGTEVEFGRARVFRSLEEILEVWIKPIQLGLIYK